MSLRVCPIQEICKKYENGSLDKSHYVRCNHPCNEFVAVRCDMGMELEMFLTGKPMACAINKGKGN